MVVRVCWFSVFSFQEEAAEGLGDEDEGEGGVDDDGEGGGEESLFHGFWNTVLPPAVVRYNSPDRRVASASAAASSANVGIASSARPS